ncbi:hypothetical protein LINGRAPRIM_LOCUS625 [Linum grandiflorum]
MLLRKLTGADTSPNLELRLEHVWKLGNPAEPERYFALGTLWTDAEGVRIQGGSLRNFAPTFKKRISVGCVYKIAGAVLCPPRPTFRACGFSNCPQITPSTKFESQPPASDHAPFNREAFKFVPFSEFPSRLPPFPYLTELLPYFPFPHLASCPVLITFSLCFLRFLRENNCCGEAKLC